MTNLSRIYIVKVIEGAPQSRPRLVRAHTKMQALHHVQRDTLKASVASQDEIVRLVSGSEGLAIEEAEGRSRGPERDTMTRALFGPEPTAANA